MGRCGGGGKLRVIHYLRKFDKTEVTRLIHEVCVFCLHSASHSFSAASQACKPTAVVQVFRPSDRQADKLKGRQAGRQTVRWVDRQAGRQTDRQTGRHTER